MSSSKELAEMIERVARQALLPLGIPHGWGNEHQRYVAAVRDALHKHADDGGFSQWGITSKEQIRNLHIAVGFDSSTRMFILNPEELANLVIQAGSSA